MKTLKIRPAFIVLISIAILQTIKAQKDFGKVVSGLDKIIGGSTDIVNASFNIITTVNHFYDGVFKTNALILDGDPVFQQLENDRKNIMEAKKMLYKRYIQLLQEEVITLHGTQGVVKTLDNAVEDSRKQVIGALNMLNTVRNFFSRLDQRQKEIDKNLNAYKGRLASIKDNYSKIANSSKTLMGGIKEVMNSGLLGSAKGKASKLGNSYLGALTGGLVSVGEEKVSDENVKENTQALINESVRQNMAATEQGLNVFKSLNAVEEISSYAKEEYIDKMKQRLKEENQRQYEDNIRITREILQIKKRQRKRIDFADNLVFAYLND